MQVQLVGTVRIFFLLIVIGPYYLLETGGTLTRKLMWVFSPSSLMRTLSTEYFFFLSIQGQGQRDYTYWPNVTTHSKRRPSLKPARNKPPLVPQGSHHSTALSTVQLTVHICERREEKGKGADVVSLFILHWNSTC